MALILDLYHSVWTTLFSRIPNYFLDSYELLARSIEESKKLATEKSLINDRSCEEKRKKSPKPEDRKLKREKNFTLTNLIILVKRRRRKSKTFLRSRCWDRFIVWETSPLHVNFFLILFFRLGAAVKPVIEPEYHIWGTSKHQIWEARQLRTH